MRSLFAVSALLLCTVTASAQTLLLQQPTVNRSHVVFAYADDLWSVPRTGGNATRLTSGAGLETAPIFSPDGKHIAFTADYDGNLDVYVMSADGGQPRRLTWHPGPDRAVGWTPDSKRILFTSARDNQTRSFGGRLFTVPLEGGHPEAVPLPHADHGCYCSDGKQIAYVPHKLPSRMAWKRYRGGTASFIWLAQLDDSSVKPIPRKDSNDHSPVWIGDHVYFLSDRDGPTTLFVYDTKSNKVEKLLDNDGEDVKSLQGGPNCLVFEQFGAIHLFDLQSKTGKKLDIRVNADLPALQPRTVKAGKMITNATISPTGVRAAFEARGEIFTVPLKKGDVRNLTRTDSVAERDPAWSPDGKSIAYFSDASGEYELHVRDQSGNGETKKFALGKAPSYYYRPVWSPDSTKIAYSDVRSKLWFLDLASGNNTLVDTPTYYARGADLAWSPDSKWLTYSKSLKNYLNAVFVYSLADKKSHQVTDGMSDARSPVFDKGGKYLYFAASTDIGPTMGGIEMSNYNHPVSRNVYIAVLDKALPSPLAPESDEEKEAEPSMPKGKTDDKGKAKATVTVKIDFAGLDQRILALPLPARNYFGLHAGKEGVLFVLEGPAAFIVTPNFVPKFTLQRFDLAKRKAEPFIDSVSAGEISANGEKVLYRQADKWHIVDAAAAPKPGDGLLKLDDIEVRIDPRAEWKQMYHEVWRIERDFLYDPGFHGVDLEATSKRFRPYLEHVASRRDLNYLFQEMLGEFSLGHVYVTGGDIVEAKGTKTGLLGADYTVENGKVRIAKIYKGENWNPDLRAPLTGPGINVPVGAYLLEVNGKTVQANGSINRYFEGTAGKATALRIASKADGSDARDITVVPIADELPLRNRSWIEANRQKVAELTKGKAAYVYLPDTAAGGYTNFNRYFFAQVDKQAVIIDERFNGGGKAADWVVDRLARPLLNLWSTRHGADYTTPAGQIFGPKVMLANEHSGSGGDYLPWAFQRYKLGPVVGKRTWGGLVGIGGYPALIDGGGVTAPHFAFWTPEGKWEVENRGVAPDIEIEFDPKLWRQGRDPQLEKAVELVLDGLAKSPPREFLRPSYPNYQRKTAERERND
jgi:tricorn protease